MWWVYNLFGNVIQIFEWLYPKARRLKLLQTEKEQCPMAVCTTSASSHFLNCPCGGHNYKIKLSIRSLFSKTNKQKNKQTK